MSGPRRGPTLCVALAVTFLAILTPACSARAEGTKRLTVLAASSLTAVFSRLARLFSAQEPDARLELSFAGTDTLAAQIEQGAPADVFAGASTKYSNHLVEMKLIEDPLPFCTNRLVVVTPPENPAHVTTLTDLGRPGVKVLIGAPSVPVGVYARRVLSNLDRVLGDGYSQRVMANVVSNEVNAESVMAKVRLGEADAGFVYSTDAVAAGETLRSIVVPDEAQAVAIYPIAVVRGSSEGPLAHRFVEFVFDPSAQRLLRAAGFGPAPG